MTPTLQRLAVIVSAAVVVSAPRAPGDREAGARRGNPERCVHDVPRPSLRRHAGARRGRLDEGGEGGDRKGAKVQADEVAVLVDYLTRFHGPLPDGREKKSC